MKRELAALETATATAAVSPVAGSIGRKTRFGNSNGVSQRLVYKRVKRSPSTAASSAAAAAETAAVVVGEEKGDDLASKLAESNGGVAVEVEASKSEEKVGSLNEKEENSLGDGEKESKGVGAVDDDESNGVKSNGEVSVTAMEVEEKEKEKAGNGEEKAEEMVVVAVEAVMEEAAVAVEAEVVAEKCGAEVEMEKLVEEALPETPLKVVASGRGKKFGVEQYQRRFTRSALKSNNVVEEKAAEVTAKAKEVKVEGTVGEVKAEVCREDTAVLENNVDDECARRATRSSVAKPKEDGPDSCLTETSDSVVATDKENAETGISNNEDGECDMDELVVEDTETMSGSPSDKLEEVTMSKQIVVSRTPTTVRELFETGLLEGCPVYYDGGKGPAALRGRIRAIGICCPCKLCRGRKVIAPSVFEIHATNVYKRAVQYIYLENGRSFIQILKACKTRMKTVAEAVRNAIGPLPERKPVVCLNCQEPYLTMDPECSDPVCCACIMSNMSPVGPVYSSRRVCSSSKYGTSQAVSSYGKLQDCNLENPASKKSKGKSAKKKAGRLPSSKMRSSPRTGRTSEPKTSEKAAKNSEEVFQEPKACSSPMTGKSLASKTPKKLLKKPFKAALSPVPSKLTRVGKSPKIDGRVKATKRLRKEILTPKPSKTPSVCGSSVKKTSGKITRKDIRLHKLVFEDDILPDGTELGYYARGKKLLDGFKQGAGIFCNCCETVISASQFEAHAGCAARRKPYCYIYTSNGVSLHELSINLIKGRRHSAKFNDDLCSICADGGDLLLCDGCPRAFHTECASLSSIPRGKWYCKYCENMFEREKFVAHNANAFAAGRVSGVDPMEQITKRSIRIVNNVGSDVSSCILCRGFDFCKSGFGPRTIILCDQCEKEYHVGCLKDHDMADLTELPEGKWFCSLGCGRIESALENLLIQGVEKLPESLLNIIRRKNLQSVSEGAADADVSWRLLSGKIASPETRPLLSQAVAIFHESFAPIVEVVSGHDLIPAMVYGRNVGGQEYGGMYCAVLTVNSVVVSAAIFRVFGPEVAELPLVATSSGNHGKGYFQALFACIERLLATLKIKTFVLPAAEEAESIWTDRFGFKKMTPDQLRQLKSNFWSMVRFQGTSMLHKPVPECKVVESPGE